MKRSKDKCRDRDGVAKEGTNAAVAAAQQYFCKLAPADRIFSVELLQERRDEVARE